MWKWENKHFVQGLLMCLRNAWTFQLFVSFNLDTPAVIMLPFTFHLKNGETSTDTQSKREGGGFLLRSQKSDFPYIKVISSLLLKASIIFLRTATSQCGRPTEINLFSSFSSFKNPADIPGVTLLLFFLKCIKTSRGFCLHYHWKLINICKAAWQN